MTKVKLVRRSTVGFTLGENPGDVEKPKGASLTIVDEAFSIREILEKYTHGIDPAISKVPVYDEEDMDYDDVDRSKFKDMDLNEKADIVAWNKEKAQRQLELLQSSGKKVPEKAKPVPGKKTDKPQRSEEEGSDEESSSGEDV